MKKSVKIIAITVAVLFIAGIVIFIIMRSGKKAISIEKFEEIVTEKGYNIAGILGEQQKDDTVVAAKAAVNNENTSLINFYILKDKEIAKKLYNENKSKLHQEQKEGDTQTEMNNKNYESNALKSNGKYIYIARIDNTVIDLVANEVEEQKVKDIVKKLGY